MSTPEQPRHDEHGRPTGGVRGAINDLLGRGDRTDDDRTDDDRRVEDDRLAQERAGARHDAGAPTGARFDGQPVDAGPAVDPRPGQQPPAAPAGARFEGQPVEQQGGDGVGGPAAPQHQGVGDRRPDNLFDAPATSGGARHGDAGPGYATPAGDPVAQHDGAAGARTVDIGGPGDADPSASTRPMPTDGTAGERAGATTPAGTGPDHVADTSRGEDAEGRERLVSTDRASSYASRWDAVKGAFVDEPRRAVRDADALVGELLDELQTLFTEQRRSIEQGLASDETSTEDMRLALRRYRSFFDRLLSI